MPSHWTIWDSIKDFLGYPDDPNQFDRAKVVLEIVFLTATVGTAAIIVNAVRVNV